MYLPYIKLQIEILKRSPPASSEHLVERVILLTPTYMSTCRPNAAFAAHLDFVSDEQAPP